MDKFMNNIIRLILTSSVGILLLIIYKHLAQKSRASHYAALITQKIEHGRG